MAGAVEKVVRAHALPELKRSVLFHSMRGAVRCGAVRLVADSPVVNSPVVGAVRCVAVRCGAVLCRAVRCGAVVPPYNTKRARLSQNSLLHKVFSVPNLLNSPRKLFVEPE